MWKNLFVVAIQFATKEQSKDVTDMFFFESNVTNYMKKTFFYVFTLKYMYHFGMSSKKLNFKGKT